LGKLTLRIVYFNGKENHMNFWMNLKVNTKAQTLVAVAVVTLVLVAGGGLLKMRTMAASEEDMSTAVKHVAMLNDLKHDLTMVRLDIVYMMALDDAEKLKLKEDDIAKREQSIKSGIEAFRKYDLAPKEKELITAFEEGWAAYYAQGKKLVEMSKAAVGNPQAHSEVIKFAAGTVAPLSEKPVKAIQDLVENNVADATATYQKDLAGYHSSLVFLVGITTGAALFLLLIGLLISRSISGPLKKVFDTLAQVAAGDLTARSSISTRDEMGMLAGEVNEMADRLMGTMIRVAESSAQLSSAASELNATAEGIAAGAETVESQTCTLATASEEMAATSADIARNCHTAAGDGKEATIGRRRGARWWRRPSRSWGGSPPRYAPPPRRWPGLARVATRSGRSWGPSRTSPTRPTCLP